MGYILAPRSCRYHPYHTIKTCCIIEISLLCFPHTTMAMPNPFLSPNSKGMLYLCSILSRFQSRPACTSTKALVPRPSQRGATIWGEHFQVLEVRLPCSGARPQIGQKVGMWGVEFGMHGISNSGGQFHNEVHSGVYGLTVIVIVKTSQAQISLRRKHEHSVDDHGFLEISQSVVIASTKMAVKQSWRQHNKGGAIPIIGAKINLRL